MSIRITLSANAGVALDADGIRIWIDALHDTKVRGFSTLTPGLQQALLECEAFHQPDYICYTHCHPDHYSEKLTQAASEHWPLAKVIAPEGKFGCFDTPIYSVEAQDLTIRFLRLPHEGAQYANVVHYGLLICRAGCNILIPADCQVASPLLLEAVGDIPIHLMLLDFPWITLHRGVDFLKKHFPDAVKVICHLPFAEDDTMGYRAVTKRRSEQMENVHILSEPLQSVTLL